eukprot:835794-Alexandrium_andersonii.AAC.1
MPWTCVPRMGPPPAPRIRLIGIACSARATSQAERTPRHASPQWTLARGRIPDQRADEDRT